jgi:hypothetical protein
MFVDFRLMLGDVNLGVETGEDAIDMVDFVTILVFAHKDDTIDGLVGVVVFHGGMI